MPKPKLVGSTKNESIIWKVLPLIIAILMALVPVVESWKLHSMGPSPEKHLELTKLGPVNPILDLASLNGDGISISLKMGDATYNNLLLSYGYLSNSGNAPILPSDYVKPLTVTVPLPWKIVAIKGAFSASPALEWKKLTDQSYEANPALLNPGDITYTVIYITSADGPASPPPQVSWDARIVNLKSIDIATTTFEKTNDRIRNAFRSYLKTRVLADKF